MIVRILGEGQFELDDATAGRLEKLDTDLGHAIAANDREWFEKALAALLAEVRENGRVLDASTIVPSDLAVPGEGSSLEEVRELLATGGTPEV